MQVAGNLVAAVGMGIQVQHADVARAVRVRAHGGVRPEDRVVAAQDDRYGANLDELPHQLANRLVRFLDAQRMHGGIAVVHH
jgi:hypothetical protein